MAERSNAAVLKTVDGQPSGGSNPSLSATEGHPRGAFFSVAEGEGKQKLRFGGSPRPHVLYVVEGRHEHASPAK